MSFCTQNFSPTKEIGNFLLYKTYFLLGSLCTLELLQADFIWWKKYNLRPGILEQVIGSNLKILRFGPGPGSYKIWFLINLILCLEWEEKAEGNCEAKLICLYEQFRNDTRQDFNRWKRGFETSESIYENALFYKQCRKPNFMHIHAILISSSNTHTFQWRRCYISKYLFEFLLPPMQVHWCLISWLSNCRHKSFFDNGIPEDR